ncbi:MAG: bifunctional DNA-formamidopyrimidine glycosylase/DNA-(apurinic or apyrimidinic site) lyase [Acidobacteriota bacterium]
MPELPEVETVCRSLRPHLDKRTVVRVDVRAPALREPLDGDAMRRAALQRPIVAVARRAKYLLMRFGPSAGRDATPGGEDALALHLGMSGRLTLVDGDAPYAPHEHLALHLDDGRRLRLVDPRRFGSAFALRWTEQAQDRHFAHLGVEPLTDAFDGPYLARRAAGRRTAVKTFLMDARIVVGVGNIYASEALWRAGVHPTRAAGRIGQARWQRLADAVRATLDQAITEGGTTLNDFTDGEGNAGYFQVSLAVYGREGAPCTCCDGTIRRIVQLNRSTFYCPGCQR